eukprot:895354-Rhodomonas_salina.1
MRQDDAVGVWRKNQRLLAGGAVGPRGIGRRRGDAVVADGCAPPLARARLRRAACHDACVIERQREHGVSCQPCSRPRQHSLVIRNSDAEVAWMGRVDTVGFEPLSPCIPPRCEPPPHAAPLHLRRRPLALHAPAHGLLRLTHAPSRRSPSRLFRLLAL